MSVALRHGHPVALQQPTGAGIESLLRRLLTAETVPAVAQAAVDAVRECLAADLSWCGTLAGDTLVMEAHNGLRTTEMMSVWKLKVGQGVGGRVARDGRPLVSRDYKRDPRRVPRMKSVIDAEGLQSAIVVPLLNDEEVVGILYAAQREPREWTPAEQELLETIGRDAGLRMGRIRVYESSRRYEEHAARAESAVAAATTLAEVLGEENDFGAGVVTLAQQLGRRVELNGADGQLLRSVPPGPPAAGEAPLWEESIGGFGTLRVYGPQDVDPIEARLTRLAARLIHLQIARESAALRERLRLRQELLQGLFDGSPSAPGALMDRAALLGLDLTTPYVIICVGEHRGATNPRRTSLDSAMTWLDSVERVIRTRYPEAIAVARADHAVLILPADLADASELQSHLTRAISRADVPLAGGLGRACLDVSDYVLSYHEARAGLELASRRTAPGQLLSAVDVGLVGLLAHTSNRQSLENVMSDVLGPLLESDAASGTEYVRTLAVYLANDRHLERTATALHVHPNTVRYRVSKAQERLGRDFHDAETRFVLELALRMHSTTNADQ